MIKSKINYLLLAILCVMVSSAVKAADYVHPTITDDNEVCIFLLSSDDTQFYFSGTGGDYSKSTTSEFVKQGQLEDGLYLYKWERPSDATGTPVTFSIYKGGTADDNIIYKDKSYVNHGVFIEAKNSTTTTIDDVAYDHEVTATAAKKTDADKAFLESEDEHSVFFETPQKRDRYVWPYDKDHGGDFFTQGSWPGDVMTFVTQLSNGNYLYKWTQKANTTSTPTGIVFSPKNDGTDQYRPDNTYENHGYYINTFKTITNQTQVYQFGKAYVTTDNTETSNLDPLAKLDAANEVSLFLESPDSADYHIWVYRVDNVNGKDSVDYPGEYFFGGTTWPGAKLNYVGKLNNGHYLFKWIMNSHISVIPTKFSICDNNDPNAKAIKGAVDAGFNNHGYYILKKDNGTSSIDYEATVTRRSDGSYATDRTTYGKRVIYEMNVGSFTPSGTISAAKERLSYLKNLGVDVIWLMPVYQRSTVKTTGNSPYAVKDFKKVNPSYGTLADLKDFVTTAHTLGMDVWLDFVANHTSTDNAWVTSHPEYYTKVNGKMVHPASDGNYYSDGQTAPTGVIIYNDVYQLDYNTTVTDATTKRTYNPASDAIEDAMKYWVNETDIDGYRFDMVSSKGVTDTFWSTATKDLKVIKQSMQFLAEADFTRDKNVSPSNFTYDYAWGFNDNLRNFGQSYTTYADNSTTDLTHITKSFLDGINGVNVDPMVYLTNHDKNWNDTKKTMKEIWGDNRYAMTVYEFTMPGMPLIYNGQEQDGTVALNYFEDTKIPWSTTMDYKMFGLITELSQLKHTNNALNDGENSGLRGDTRLLNSYDHNGLFAYERIKGDQHVLVVLNLSGSAKSNTILGATQGTWKRVLSGNNEGIDNTYKNEEIGEVWHAKDVPAHGFQIFTLTGEKHNYATGIYFVCDDNENNAVAHPMEHSAEDDNYNYYRFVIDASDFDKLSTKAGNTTPESRMSFRFQEYYDFLGTTCKKDVMFGAVAEANDVLSVNGTKEYSFGRNEVANTNPFYLEKGNETDNVSKYIITLARNKQGNTDEGKVTLQILKVGDLMPGYYLITPSNVQSSVVSEVHQWRFNSRTEDEAAVSDRYLSNLNEDKVDLCSFTINANDFDSYIPADRRSGNTIQFRIRQLGFDASGELKDNSADIDPSADDAKNSNSTFDASVNDNKVYEDAHWDVYDAANPSFFKIVFQPDVAKYIIQMWKTSASSNGQTRIRVYYVRKFNYQGSTIEDVTASNEDCYLYNVDAQKFLYVGNNWGTMASLLYDDLGTRLNISAGKSDENPDYKLIRTRMENNTTVPDGHMLGIDDWSYDANSQWPENRLDSGFIYTDRDNGNRWIFEKADNVSYANTYTLKLFDLRDGRFHYLVADHQDGDSEEAKIANTRVKYKAVGGNGKVVRQKNDGVALSDHPAYGNKQYVQSYEYSMLQYDRNTDNFYVDGYGIQDEFTPGVTPGYIFKANFSNKQDSIDFQTYNNQIKRYAPRDYGDSVQFYTNDNTEIGDATYDFNIRYICNGDKKVTLRIVEDLHEPNNNVSFMRTRENPVSCYDPGNKIVFEETQTAPSTGSDTDIRTAKTLTFKVNLRNNYDPNNAWATRGYVILIGHRDEYQEYDENDENPLYDDQGNPVMNSYIDVYHQEDDVPHFVSYNIVRENNDERPADLTYARWQIVTYSDLVDKLKNENADFYGGTTADATFLLKDQGFTRYIHDTWDTEVSDTSTVKVTKNAIGDYSDVGMYWNGHITGKGKVYQDVDVPMYGVYQFDTYGFYNGSPTNMYYQYAKSIDTDGKVTWSDVLGNTPLKEDKNQTYTDRTTDIATGKMFYEESVLGGEPEHRTTQFIYVPQDAAITNGNYRIRIGFNKTADADGDYTAVDDVHLHYIGKAPFVLDDTWSNYEKTVTDKNDKRENVPVWIERKFFANKWNTLVLPVSVSTTQLRSIFGDGVQVAQPYGLADDDPYLIRFNPVDLSSGTTAIEAGKYYIVKPNKLVGTTSVMDLKKNEGEDTYSPVTQTITNDDGTRFYNLGNHNLADMLTKVDSLTINTFGFNAKSKNDTTGHNTISMVGSFSATKAPARSYVFASDGNMYHLTSEMDMKGFRFYIVDNNDGKTPTELDMTSGSLRDDLDAVLASFINHGKNGNGTTGINNVSTDHGLRLHFDDNVYDMSGRLVSIGGKIDNLPSGVYIMNGRKFVKK